MKLDITKIANVILYCMDKEVLHLNDRKFLILLFMMDYKHKKLNGEKIFGEEYLKEKRNPQAKTLGEIFDIIANGEDLDEDDPRLYLIQELLDYLDIEIITKDTFIELKFIKMEEEFDESLFNKDEMKTIKKVIEKYKDATARKVANDCFQIEEVRQSPLNELIL